MAVEIRYVVVRDGRETMTFTDKKTADAYDKKLEAAERLCELMAEADVEVDEETRDALAVHLVEHAAEVMRCIKGVRPVARKTASQSTTSSEQPAKLSRAG